MKDPAEALNHHHARDKLLICDLLPPFLVLRTGRRRRDWGEDGVQTGTGEEEEGSKRERSGRARTGGELGSVVEMGGGGRIVTGHSGVWGR